ncbi:NHLP leader peptide family RiPP precursor [Paenibacillus protaetiae]|uniref:NHLP leader peptide family natural product n=1 Tax=Paenibacillus protaetiae TaxID=2509456 RepID=A0A4P6F4D2_9BACL|nr:NHLP leader peptide family RiPP precursor [Paenibacillus protaetiae]QAY68037.1 NHLP leader peptide family natural product precursor [Paenibacillus protaetiae]
MSIEELRKQIIEKAWEDESFRQELQFDAAAAIERAFAIPVPAGINITVLEETRDNYYLVIPANPADEINNEIVDLPAWD